MIMVGQKLYLLTEKCNIIVRNCGQGRDEDVLADMGDFTNTITGLIPDVQFFSSAEFLNTLQKLLIAMTKPDIEAIRTTIQKSIIIFYHTFGKNTRFFLRKLQFFTIPSRLYISSESRC